MTNPRGNKPLRLLIIEATNQRGYQPLMAQTLEATEGCPKELILTIQFFLYFTTIFLTIRFQGFL